MINKLIATFLLTTFITNTAYAEKIILDTYGAPIKTQTTIQTNIIQNTLIAEEKTTYKQVVQNPNLTETINNEKVLEKKVSENAFANLNYNASTINMDLSQALKSYHNYEGEIEPSMIRAYNLQRKEGLTNYKLDLEKAPTRSESYFVALEKGIIPKYFPPSYYVNDNEAVMTLIVEAYDILLKNNFSENDIKNFMHFYSDRYFKDTNPISIAEIRSIINNKSIAKEDKLYYIYAKMAAKHHNNPAVETDVIESLKLIKQNPKIIIKKEIYKTSLDDNILLILNYYTEPCKTEEIIKKVLGMKNISDGEKFLRILGELKKESLKAENKNYPEILYEVAETGILSSFFNGKEALKYYNNEKVLQDILSTSKLLLQNKYWEWCYDENGDFATIAPELLITTKIVQEVLNDKKIPIKDKEDIIGRRLLKEKYLAYNEKRKNDGYDDDLVTDEGFLLIEKGYVKYLDTFTPTWFLYEKEAGSKFNKIIDIYKNKGFSDAHIKTLVDCNAINTDIAKKVDSPNEILRQNLLQREKDDEWNKIINTYFDTGLINIDNIVHSDISNLRYHKYDIEDIKNVAKLKNIEGFTDKDIQHYVDYYRRLFPYINISFKKVMNDNAIKKEDRPIFVIALAEREYEKHLYPKVIETRGYLIDEGINPEYLSGIETYSQIELDLYIYMKNKLGYDLKQCEQILKYPNNEKTIKIVKNEKLDYEEKIKALNKAERIAEFKDNSKKALEEFAGKALLVITAPIWGIPYLILMTLIERGGWHN